MEKEKRKMYTLRSTTFPIHAAKLIKCIQQEKKKSFSFVFFFFPLLLLVREQALAESTLLEFVFKKWICIIYSTRNGILCNFLMFFFSCI